jgi:hypothetical protein
MIGVKSFAVMARLPAPPDIEASAFQASVPANRTVAVAASMSMNLRIGFLQIFIAQTRESFYPPRPKSDAVKCRRSRPDRPRLARYGRGRKSQDTRSNLGKYLIVFAYSKLAHFHRKRGLGHFLRWRRARSELQAPWRRFSAIVRFVTEITVGGKPVS